METLTIVLTGGRSTRMGGRHKPALEVGGVSIIDRAVAAAPGRIVVAGSAEGLTVSGVDIVREDPPFAGPVAGIAGALASFSAGARTILLLAGDMPFLDPGFLGLLCDSAPAIARDEAARDQYLCAAWPEKTLRKRLIEVGPPDGLPMRRLYAGATFRMLDAPSGSLRDIDAPADLRDAEERAVSGAHPPAQHARRAQGTRRGSSSR